MASRATINALKEKRAAKALQKADTDQKIAEADRLKESTKKAIIEKHIEADSNGMLARWHRLSRRPVRSTTGEEALGLVRDSQRVGYTVECSQ